MFEVLEANNRAIVTVLLLVNLRSYEVEIKVLNVVISVIHV